MDERIPRFIEGRHGAMSRKKLILIIVLASLFFTIAIPIAINESYKHGVVYVTMWGAPEVLSYYGTLLGAGTTIAALVATIAFTKKQIEHDRFLEYNYTKWERIESVVTKILTDISPLCISDFEKMDDTSVQTLFTMFVHLQAYETAIKSSLDTMKGHINPHDYQNIAAFEEQLSNCITQFSEIEQDLKNEIGKLMFAAMVNQGTISVPAWLMFYNAAREISERIPPVHDGPYQDLLSKKREVFDKIYADIEQQAEEILQFKKRKKNSHAHT